MQEEAHRLSQQPNQQENEKLVIAPPEPEKAASAPTSTPTKP
jgi:hypothetical protein